MSDKKLKISTNGKCPGCNKGDSGDNFSYCMVTCACGLTYIQDLDRTPKTKKKKK